ncbi:MAG: TRZ/ATZ family hydrolase [Candidatus Pelagadaptatus aseana]|uniref:TRZ/ATZ family hydrolase n=1 Tax=Candidatus Pelagadaptatus aseana TaxID=3120508 RepID=UPI0039B2FA8C
MVPTATLETVDLLIHARWILPIIPRDKVLKDCSLVINGHTIQDILPTAEAKKRYQADEEYDLGQHLLMPGLINAHGHTAMSLFRGYADDQPLQTWLEQHIWPAEQQWVNPEFVETGTELAIAEMIRSGTTTFSDMYFFPEQAAQAAAKAGMRCQLAFPVLDFPTAWAQDPDEYISKGLALHDDYAGHPLVSIAFGPHAPYTVSDEPLQRIATLAEELQTPIQIHLHETASEVDAALAETGKRPIARLNELGLLSPLSQCVHMTQLNDEDIELLHNTGSNVVHCPSSNMKLASGFCPVAKLQQQNVNVALGTDGAASNNSLNLFAEMQLASLLAKGVSGDATAVDAATALEMATINGAKALGMEDSIGSLEKGKKADLIAIEMSQLEQLPIYNPASQLVYTEMGSRVSHNWIGGRCVLDNYRLQTLHEETLSQKALQWQSHIARD